MSELSIILNDLKTSKYPEMVFGMPTSDIYENVQIIYHNLIKTCHEDMYTEPVDKEMAKEASILLNQFWVTAKSRIKDNTYGNINIIDNNNSNITFSTKKNTYIIFDRITTNDICDIFSGQVINKRNNITSEVQIKVPHCVNDNDLMTNEANSLTEINKKIKSFTDPEALEFAQRLGYRIPALIESIRLSESKETTKKVVNTFLITNEYNVGWYSLEDIHRKYPNGISTRIMAFIFNRCMEALIIPQLINISHCNITPNNILIHAKTHNGQLIDWTNSTKIGKSGSNVPYIIKKYNHYYPNEIINNNTINKSTDLFMIAWNMIYLLGGDMDGSIPDNIEPEITQFLNKCIQPNSSKRFATIELAYKEFEKLCQRLWGDKKFVELNMD